MEGLLFRDELVTASESYVASLTVSVSFLEAGGWGWSGKKAPQNQSTRERREDRTP